MCDLKGARWRTGAGVTGLTARDRSSSPRQVFVSLLKPLVYSRATSCGWPGATNGATSCGWPGTTNGATSCGWPGATNGADPLRPAWLFRLFWPVSFLCLLIALLAPVPTFAHAVSRATPESGLSLALDMGFDGYYRVGYWTPVRVTMANSGANFSGTLALQTFSARSATNQGAPILSPWSFTQPVTLPHNARRTVTLTLPVYVGSSYHPSGVTAKLMDAQGRTVASQQASPEYAGVTDILVGVLSDNSASFNALSYLTLPDHDTSILVAALDRQTFPTSITVLSAFDVVILDNFATDVLSGKQLGALQAWVNQGGALIEVGGANWQRTLASLPAALLPVRINGATQLAPGTHLLPPELEGNGGADPALNDTLQETLTASTATLPVTKPGNTTDSVTILSSDGVPLMVQARDGQGTICYLAFDPALPAFASRAASTVFWQSLLLRVIGDRALLSSTSTFSSGPGDLFAKEGVLATLQPPVVFSPLLAGLLLLLYLALLIVAGVVIVRRLKRPQWRWRIVLAAIALFSLCSYALFAYQHRSALQDNTFSVVQLSQINSGQSIAHSVIYHGLFVPDRGDVQVQLPATELALPVPYPSSSVFSEDDPRVTITPATEGVMVHLPAEDSWSFHTLVGQQDITLPGGVQVRLSLQNNRIVGSLSNTLNTDLNDAYILLPHGFVALGNLAGGNTIAVNAAIQAVRPGTTLADALARSLELKAPYFPYNGNKQPQNEQQRHLALLEALSGVGFSYPPCNGPCMAQAIVSNGAIFTLPPGTPSNISLPVDTDPLLLNGAPTLIGWAASPLDGANDVTINGVTPNGAHETLVQTPLPLNFAGPLSIPPGLISGTVVAQQDSDVETTTPGVYSLTTGSVTFEFALPGIAPTGISSVTIREPSALATSATATQGPGSIPDQAQASLYNWQTRTWDAITLTSGSFTTDNPAAYIGADGRVLLQVTSKQPGSLLLFSKPSLSLNGSGQDRRKNFLCKRLSPIVSAL